jgi:hypothetical protein
MSTLQRLLLTVTILCSSCFQVSHQFSLGGGSSGNSSDKRHVSAAKRARREEDIRRQERSSEVVPGKTSAIHGAKDFELNVKRTELEWSLQASGFEQKVKGLSVKGLDEMRMLRLEEADKAFEAVFEMKPNAYCWQAGIVKFYLGDYRSAAECFARNARYYESKFDQVASEERIWRDACELKLLGEARGKRKENIDPPVAALEPRDETAPNETRKVIRIAGDLFAASVDNDLSAMMLARAKLRSVCGEYDDDANQKTKKDLKMWRLSAWFYLGLHYDVTGDMLESKDCMKMALRQCIGGNGNDIIQTLPMLHMARRDWFDDDDFDEDLGADDDDDDFDWDGSVSDSKAIQSIEDSVQGMKISELQSSLRLRGKKSNGSKSVLRDRLVRCLLEDAGLETDESYD